MKSSIPYTQQRTTDLSIIHKIHGSETIDRITKQLMTRQITKVTPSRKVVVIEYGYCVTHTSKLRINNKQQSQSYRTTNDDQKHIPDKDDAAMS